MHVRVIPYVMPLLFGYDETAEGAAAAAPAADHAASAQQAGPGFLGLATVRSNMQVSAFSGGRPDWGCVQACSQAPEA